MKQEELIKKAFEGLEESQIIDYHVHAIGINPCYLKSRNVSEEKLGNFIHPNLLTWKHPALHIACLLFQKAFHIKDVNEAEKESIKELLRLVQDHRGRYCLLAMDGNYEHPDKTKFIVSNEYVFHVVNSCPNHFIAVSSIHPYRPDALDELEKWASRGVIMVKWLPNIMGIDPLDKRCIGFYQKMHDLNMVLLTHVGSELLLPFVVEQEYGNPLRLRAALDHGVHVIMAHSATCGTSLDLDLATTRFEENFNLFLRLIQEPRYENLLFGDLSAVTLVHRMRYLKQLLELSQPNGLLSGRLVNGSDYPLPALNWSISTFLLASLGYITFEERRALNALFQRNPLLFDFVLKRTLRHPKTGVRFPLDIFVNRIVGGRL